MGAEPIQVTFTLRGANGEIFNLNESGLLSFDNSTDITFEHKQIKVDKRKYNKGIDFYRK